MPSIVVVLLTSVEIVPKNAGRLALAETYGLPLSFKEKRSVLAALRLIS